MAAELKKTFGVDAKLKMGSGGVFDVVVDGRLVYSKRETGRFPEPGEVPKLIGNAPPPAPGIRAPGPSGCGGDPANPRETGPGAQRPAGALPPASRSSTSLMRLAKEAGSARRPPSERSASS
ncbi:MAG: hypothetical protein IPP07_29135 [Holophagales bacterium]|nr:hypothetical protein [Holophagales bacterium]